MKIRIFVSDRQKGVSSPPYESLNIALHVGDDPKRVHVNREILKKEAGIEAIQFMEQIHSDEIVTIESLIHSPKCDGLITTTPNLALAVMSADCYGVLLFGDGVIAALHAGRRGAMKRIVSKALVRMRELGAKNTSAFLSPGIGVCCYEVGQEIITKTERRYVKGKRIDIKKMIYDQLREGGVEYIQDMDICTCCTHDYFSYRREGVTGRFASLIWMER